MNLSGSWARTAPAQFRLFSDKEVGAMDRRRFIPSPEGLEGRALLSSLFGSSKSTNTSQNNPIDTLPGTFKLKETRVDHLPFYLEQFQQGRVIPAAVIEPLQADLKAIIGELHKPPPADLVAFNLQLRATIPKQNLSSPAAHILNQDFGNILINAGASIDQTLNLRRDMDQLVKVDSVSKNPLFLATNDYALVIQTALGIGRPINSPAAPDLAGHKPGKGSLIPITAQHQPTLVGTYEDGATIQIIDDAGNILGTGPVLSTGANKVTATTGKYAVTLTTPLDDGLHHLRAVADDGQGHLSLPSPAFTLRVITRPHPRGPLGLNSKTT